MGLTEANRDIGSVEELWRYYIGLVLERGGADLYLEVMGSGGVKINYRDGGRIYQVDCLGEVVGKGLVNYVKLMGGMEIGAVKRLQEGKMRVVEGIFLRLSVMRTEVGEVITVRILNGGGGRMELEGLGCEGVELDFLREVVGYGHGLVLIGGATGSGKTTTLYSLVERMDKERLKVMSVEDPVEREIEGVVQINVHREVGVGFGVVLKHLLRQDPDVIMVGEIRDGETARMSVQAAMTGHLVMSTVHAGGIGEVWVRMKELGVSEGTLRDVVRGLVWQRLVEVGGGGMRGEFWVERVG